MKKICMCICFLCCISGCFHSSSTTVVCVGVANGSSISSVLSGNGDKLIAEVYEERTNLSEHGYHQDSYTPEEEQEIISIIRDKKYKTTVFPSVNGIDYAFTLEDNYFVFTLSIDYIETNYEQLKELNFIESNGLFDFGISLSKTKDSYEKKGMTCK